VKRVLVIDDERPMRRALEILLGQLELEAVLAESAEAGLASMAVEHVDLVMTDVRLPGMSGVEALRRIRELDPSMPVIVLTAYGTIQDAVEAMRLGAFDYILKPFELDAVAAVVRKAIELRHYRAENRYLRERLDRLGAPSEVVLASPAMQRLFEHVRQVAATPTTVLITGETGVGKEIVARAIHELGPRRDKLLVAINCAAIPAELLESELFGHVRGAFTGAQAAREGKFELADGGTLFLDEIGDMPPPLQAKLLRVLQDGVFERVGSNRQIRVDVRVVSSTNRELDAAVASGSFREDLYYRLNVFRLHVPPLRERREDIGPLAQGFVARYGRDFGKGAVRLTAGAVARLERHEWPGNVRELENLMERVAVLAPGGVPDVDEGMIDDLLPAARALEAPDGEPGGRLAPALDALERTLIERALQQSGDDKPEAARRLGVSERTLWYKLKKHGL
jgi:two-component system, NtrC family, response regulator AtoC